MNRDELKKAISNAWKAYKAAEKAYGKCIEEDGQGYCDHLFDECQSAWDKYEALANKQPVEERATAD